MGAVYKNKKRSCALCKPHKRGISPKHKVKYRAKAKAANIEIRTALLLKGSATP